MGEDNKVIKLKQTMGDYGVSFAGPDFLDYPMIFKISGGEFDGERISIDSSYHLFCGTLEINSKLIVKYVLWENKLTGCALHMKRSWESRYRKKLTFLIFWLPIWRNKMEQTEIEKIIQGLDFSTNLDVETASLAIALQLLSAFPPKFDESKNKRQVANEIATHLGSMARSISPKRYNK